ncbi:MAG TPA: HAMP domain-containing sensor histidine kinase [Bacteroidales bacterium]|nr:HAMP domain-containing sensor histidine kinase [Bacteroidales bacterium]
MKLKLKFQSDLKISLLYIVTGSLWILFSDKAARAFSKSEEAAHHIELYKGWFFVTITGFLLYLLIHAELKKRNKILNELQKSKLKAEESNKLKSAFLANISHYLRTPMNSILGFVDLLQNRNLDEKKKERFLSIVNEQSQHLLQFINNIIEISKLQGGQTEINVKEFSINELIRKLQVRYQTEIECSGRGNTIVLKGAYLGKDVVVNSDQQKLEYILTNLLSNAVKFTKSGEINFGYNLKDSQIEFFVSDTGIGIPLEKQEIIIDTFMHSDPDVEHENIGIGLGLAITNGMVKLLGGNLWLKKSDDKGTDFRFSIPVDYFRPKNMENGL